MINPEQHTETAIQPLDDIGLRLAGWSERMDKLSEMLNKNQDVKDEAARLHQEMSDYYLQQSLSHSAEDREIGDHIRQSLGWLKSIQVRH